MFSIYWMNPNRYGEYLSNFRIEAEINYVLQGVEEVGPKPRILGR